MPPSNRMTVEAFLYGEAALLDAWDLDGWLELFDEDATYQVPNPGNPPGASPSEVVYFIADNRERLRGRVDRLKKKNAHVEYPHSRTVHNISNVRVIEDDGSIVLVECNFVVYRNKNDVTDIFFGRSRYRLRRIDGAFMVREKVAELACDALRPQRMISVIL